MEDVLETQELNQESPVSNNIFSKVANDVTRGISRIGRASRTQLGLVNLSRVYRLPSRDSLRMNLTDIFKDRFWNRTSFNKSWRFE